jgi:hypothetical protein
VRVSGVVDVNVAMTSARLTHCAHSSTLFSFDFEEIASCATTDASVSDAPVSDASVSDAPADVMDAAEPGDG